MHRRLLSKIWHPPFNLTISVSWKIFSEIWREIPMAEEFINWNVYPFLSKKWCFIFHRLYRWSLQFSWQDLLHEMNETRRCRWLLELVLWTFRKFTPRVRMGAKIGARFLSPRSNSRTILRAKSRVHVKSGSRVSSFLLFPSLPSSSFFFFFNVLLQLIAGPRPRTRLYNTRIRMPFPPRGDTRGR